MSEEIVLTVGVATPVLSTLATTPTVVLTSTEAPLTLSARSASTLTLETVEAL